MTDPTDLRQPADLHRWADPHDAVDRAYADLEGLRHRCRRSPTSLSVLAETLREVVAAIEPDRRDDA